MKMNKYLMALACAIATTAHAETNWYGLISFSETKISPSKSDFDDIYNDIGLSVTSSRLEDKGTGYKLQVGYQPIKYFAIEGGYVDLDQAQHTAHVTTGSEGIRSVMTIESSGWNLNAVGILPITNEFSILAKVGAIRVKEKITVKASSGSEFASDSSSDSNSEVLYGLGIAYAPNDKMNLRAEYERYDLGDDSGTDIDIDVVSLGIAFKF